MEKQKNIPQLRFPDFEGDWERKSLYEVGNNIIGLTYSPKNVVDDGIIVLRSSNIKDDTLDLNDQVRVNAEISKKLTIKKGDILICTRNGSQRLIGKNIIIDDVSIPMTFGAFMSVFRSEMNSFIVHLFKTEWYNEQIQMNLGARINQITTGQLNKFYFKFPSIPEQQKIASFFTAIDQKISQLKRKKTLLEQYKKGVMQKIFSQEIRFKDDNGKEFPKWERKRLGNLLVERNTQASKSDNYPLMAFIANKGVAEKGERYNREFLVNDEGNKKYKQTEYGDFIYSSNNLETGSIGLNSFGSASISPVYSIFKIRESCNIQFLNSFLVRNSFIKKMTKYRQGVVYGQWRIHESDFLKIEESIPSLEEQTKIANFLSAIDDKINNTQKQIEKAEVWKKGLLQKIFV
jgi:type I restriction enzyme S subunit